MEILEYFLLELASRSLNFILLIIKSIKYQSYLYHDFIKAYQLQILSPNALTFLHLYLASPSKQSFLVWRHETKYYHRSYRQISMSN